MNTDREVHLAIAEAIKNRDHSLLDDVRYTIEGWLIPEDEKEAWLELIEAAEIAIER